MSHAAAALLVNDMAERLHRDGVDLDDCRAVVAALGRSGFPASDIELLGARAMRIARLREQFAANHAHQF
jgi:hypothetical protein